MIVKGRKARNGRQAERQNERRSLISLETNS